MAADPSQEEDRIFEDEVRRFARLLYRGNDSRGAAMVDDRERDGIFETDEVVIAIEATRSTRKAKAVDDVRKLRDLVSRLSRQHPDRAVRGFFITAHDPTADQREAVGKAGPQVSTISFATFQAKLIDSRMYVTARKDYAFGSVLDPVTQKPEIEGKYVSIGLVELPEKSTSHSVDQIRQYLEAGRCVVLQGDFGAGKSMTLREVFLRTAKDLLASRSTFFTIYLNLRDHQGQVEPAEALERHARLIGFPHPNQLVRAWRSGRAAIQLDGFDEISTANWPGRIGSLHDIRRRSVKLVRQFIRQTPRGAGLILAGRSHYFDNHDEMVRALDLPHDTLYLSASDLTLQQVRELMSARAGRLGVPGWLPPRPLLIAHLAGRDLLSGISDVADDVDAAEGWDFLVDAICDREARVDIGVDGTAVRSILERLATRARTTPSGLGPLAFDELTAAFQYVCSYVPDADSFILLQRLAGLQVYEPVRNSRSFVDEDLADALRAGDIVRFIESPFVGNHNHLLDLKSLMADLGVSVISHMLDRHGVAVGVIRTALERALVLGDRAQELSADLLRLILHLGEAAEHAMTLQSLIIPSIELSGSAMAPNVTLRDCWIHELDLTGVSDLRQLPLMQKCVIDNISGVAGIDGLSRDRLRDCTIGSFSDSAENTSAILSLPISDFQRVMLSALQKLFRQSGKGRKEAAFYRGALTEAQRSLVPVVLSRLQSEGVAWRGRSRGTTLWSPNRTMGERVRHVLSSPASSDDSLLRE